MKKMTLKEKIIVIGVGLLIGLSVHLLTHFFPSVFSLAPNVIRNDLDEVIQFLKDNNGYKNKYNQIKWMNK